MIASVVFLRLLWCARARGAAAGVGGLVVLGRSRAAAAVWLISSWISCRCLSKKETLGVVHVAACNASNQIVLRRAACFYSLNSSPNAYVVV